jgi:hypothetical protein
MAGVGEIPWLKRVVNCQDVWEQLFCDETVRKMWVEERVTCLRVVGRGEGTNGNSRKETGKDIKFMPSDVTRNDVPNL